MQDREEIYLTKEGKEKLQIELEDLEGPQRTEIAARLKSAIEMGDLSENADYHKAKEDQGFLEGKIYCQASSREAFGYFLSNAAGIEAPANPFTKRLSSNCSLAFAICLFS